MQSERITEAASQRLATLRKFMARETSRVEIAPPQILDTGGLWVFYDHARFTVFEDGRFGSQPYGPQCFYGLKVGEIKRPEATA